MKAIFKKDELKYLGAFYFERFISHILFFIPAFQIIFFNDKLSLTQVSILFSAFALSMFILEIPTGAFADIFGRKASTLFAYFMLGITLPLFIFVHNFYLLILLFICWGGFHTFFSGAREAWTIDNLKYFKRKDLVETYYLRTYSFMSIGMFLSGFLGAFIVAQFGINYIWIAGSLSWWLSFFLLLPVSEHKLTKEKKMNFRGFYHGIKIAVSYSIGHKVLSMIFFALFFIMVRGSFSSELVWQPYLRELGMPLYFFGFIFSLSMLLSSISPFVATRVRQKIKNEKSYLVILLGVVMILNYLVFFVQGYILGLLLFLAMIFLIDMFIPVNDAYVQKFISSKSRATILSFKSMVKSIAYVLSYPLAGYLAEVMGRQNTIIAGGLFLIPAIYFYGRIDKKDKIIG